MIDGVVDVDVVLGDGCVDSPALPLVSCPIGLLLNPVSARSTVWTKKDNAVRGGNRICAGGGGGGGGRGWG